MNELVKTPQFNQQNSEVGLASPCVIFRSSSDIYGYPRIFIDGKYYRMSRWILHITGRMDLNSASLALHHCDTPSCINPAHLYPGTLQDNAKDKEDRQRVPAGEFHGSSKYSNILVAKIREEHANGSTQSELKAKYNIPYSTLHGILYNLRRKRG